MRVFPRYEAHVPDGTDRLSADVDEMRRRGLRLIERGSHPDLEASSKFTYASELSLRTHRCLGEKPSRCSQCSVCTIESG